MKSPARRRLALALLAAVLCAAGAGAHEGYEASLAQVDAALAADPADPELWCRRAALERSAGVFERASADLARAEALGLSPAHAERERGLLLLELQPGRLAEAERHLARARELAPADVEAVTGHADALAALGRWRAAADGYARALALAPGSGPDLHLSRVRALAGGGAAARAEALRAVDQALARLGPVPALEQAGIELELAAGRSDAALARLDRMPELLRGRAEWHVQRAGILAGAGRRDEAIAAYDSALAALAAEPAARRAAPAAARLEQNAREARALLAQTALESSR
jgi:tetratricopeptide (TPR) repeat protein